MHHIILKYYAETYLPCHRVCRRFLYVPQYICNVMKYSTITIINTPSLCSLHFNHFFALSRLLFFCVDLWFFVLL